MDGRHVWSEAGAAAVVALAADYGSFMLRNALALALAMDAVNGLGVVWFWESVILVRY